MGKVETIDAQAGLEKLRPLLEKRKLAVFVGSGISVEPPSSLPTWSQLLDNFIGWCESIQDEIDEPDRFVELLQDARGRTPQDTIRVATALVHEIRELDRIRSTTFSKSFRKWIMQTFSNGNANRFHRAIVNTRYQYILTTNYDNLLENAAGTLGDEAAKFEADPDKSISAAATAARKHLYKLRNTSFSMKQAEQVAKVVYSESPAILHMHGDIDDLALEDFVFTAQDYMRVRKNYSGFTLVLQALFMRFSFLFVGYGGTDPHMEELIEELSHSFSWSKDALLPQYYVVLRKSEVGEVLRRYKALMRTQIIEVDDYDELGTSLAELERASPVWREPAA